MGGYSLAVDIGGTFTDVVLRHASGAAVTDKTLTTHKNLLEGFFRAVDLALGKAGIGPKAVTEVTVHATTLVTNAVIVETVFAWPGLGLYITNSLQNADMNAVLGGTIVVGSIFIGLNLLSDLLYKVLDPRTRTR